MDTRLPVRLPQRGHLLLVSLLACQLEGHAQVVDCSNIGFEEGTTRGWVLTNGSVTASNQRTVYQNETVGTFENGHLVTSLSNGNDPKITAEAIPMVAPGSTHSLRIGNVTRGSRFDRIKGSFVVTNDNTLFQYRFAVILQLPNHQPYQQPGFSVRITNQAGTTLACNEYDVAASATVSGFKAQGDILYRNWTTGAIDLKAYLGQTVMVEVTAHGCTEQRHFGYAYFDAQCLKAEITQALYCPPVDKNVTLKAPDGFASYAWNTGETTPTIQVAPKQGDRYQVTVTPFSSLNTTCQFQLSYAVNVTKPVDPTRQAASICEGDGYQVGDSTYRKTGVYTTAIKRGALRCDSLVETTLTVRPMARSSQSITLCDGDSIRVGTTVYRSTGTYQTRLARPVPRCDSLVTTQLTVNPFTVSLTEQAFIRPGDSTQLRATVVSTGATRYRWTPAAGLSCPTCAVTWAKPTATTQYSLLVENTELGCQRTADVIITVGSCVIYAPDAFTPNNDGTNDVFVIPGNDCIQQINELTIYDRWGEVIYQCRHVTAGEPRYGWDGRYQGTLVGAGVYAYKLELALIGGLVIKHLGKVLLIR